MSDFKKLSKLNVLIEDCHDAIRRQGAHARVIFKVPGKWGKQTNKRMFPGGPSGKILAQAHDGNKLIYLFRAAETITELEEIKNDITTGGNRD